MYCTFYCQCSNLIWFHFDKNDHLLLMACPSILYLGLCNFNTVCAKVCVRKILRILTKQLKKQSVGSSARWLCKISLEPGPSRRPARFQCWSPRGIWKNMEKKQPYLQLMEIESQSLNEKKTHTDKPFDSVGRERLHQISR